MKQIILSGLHRAVTIDARTLLHRGWRVVPGTVLDLGKCNSVCSGEHEIMMTLEAEEGTPGIMPHERAIDFRHEGGCWW